ncbi:FAD-dependent oxidoreductase [Streptomyces noursei]|uniref:FAD-dependent oxidoreductase n=1 Tax=Streptomyces noursei TaxID=1971 RepID=UPI001672FA29|nr:NAD(P)/FAD-dependent oxidoreductase [Streptomyces noursei]MCZ1018952.1 NAD(P)/FAD-dependent oxidoreductase [Streptomyces noursei]GGX56195.1 FAD-dependent oxidoreductase [Streptomyces noursei]
MHIYDVIIVGGRCAGASLATLLARAGLDVLLVDKGTFPSDTLSTHFIHPPALDALRRWDLLDRADRCGAPKIERLVWSYEDVELSGFPENPFGIDYIYSPRRYVFDMLLLEAAIEAGAEFRERFRVHDLVRADSGEVVGVRGGGPSGAVVERARFVVGADGAGSAVAKLVDAPTHWGEPALTCTYYSYFAGLDVTNSYMRCGESSIYGAVPTNDDLTMVSVVNPRHRLDELRKDVDGNFLKTIRGISPDFAEQVAGAERVERMYAMANQPNYVRGRYGPGWALMGDAAYLKDPITALGITDAFRDADLLAGAVVDSLSGARDVDTAMKEYEQRRHEFSAPLFEMTLAAARLEPPTGDSLAYMRSLMGDQAATDRFFGVGSSSLRAPVG